MLVSSARATERRRVQRAAEREARSQDLDSAWVATVEAVRPWLGARVDVVDRKVEPDEFPSTSVEERLRGEVYVAMLFLRNGTGSVESVVETARSLGAARILGPNFYRMPCVACGVVVKRRAGVALEVAAERELRLSLCAEHAPVGW